MPKINVDREMARRRIADALHKAAMQLGYFGDSQIYYDFAEKVLLQQEEIKQN